VRYHALKLLRKQCFVNRFLLVYAHYSLDEFTFFSYFALPLIIITIMTYCLGIKVKEGLVAIADTRITSGTDVTTKKKLSSLQKPNCSLFIMTSGLRSVRDKAMVYFDELLESNLEQYNKLYKVVNAFGEQVKRVADEDRETLEKAGFKFNLNTIIGGQMKDDEEHKLFLLYPEGNWVELGQGAPYVIIGNAAQGKAILNRILNEDTSLKLALKAGFLSFDSTRISAADVGFPIDVALYKKDTYNLVEYHYESSDLESVSAQWHQELKNALNNTSNQWIESAFNQLEHHNTPAHEV
jgi:putative proteasome-type protease